MKISLHKKFLKQYKKLSDKDKIKFREKRDIFLLNPFALVLNNHKLNGKYSEYRSINITGDLRVLYKQKREMVTFFSIDTHSNLYG